MATANLDMGLVTGRLDPAAMAALEAAVAACLRRTNYRVEPEHWLLALLRVDGGDVQRACRRFGVDPDVLDEQLNGAIDRFRRGDGSRRPEFSPQTVEMIEGAWLAASMRFGDTVVRGGHLLLALAEKGSLWTLLVEQSPQLAKVKADALAEDLQAAVGTPAEDVRAATVAEGPRPTSTAALDRFTLDLTALAAAGKLDAIVGRDREIDQCVQALGRRRQNNPILVGDAGVGKTAIVEGLAVRLARGQVDSPLLRHAVVRSLDLGTLQAGAGVRGEFEQRVRAVVDEVRASAVPVVLFIDEAHMLLGAGGAEGVGDAANLLKPALARGELRCIAATTWGEYKRFFERDAALSRRFDLVKVNEPDEPTACLMLRAMLPALEQHHGVRVLDEAVTAAVALSKRYLPGRQLPDKAVGLLDTACTAVALSTSVEPPPLQDCRRRIEDADHALRLLEREQAAGSVDPTRIAELTAERATAEAERVSLDKRYARERSLVMDVRLSWETVVDQSLEPWQRDHARQRLVEANEVLAEQQAGGPLARAVVDRQAVADVVGRWTGIPVGRMSQDERRAVLELEDRLNARVVGQRHAIATVAEAVRRSRAGLGDAGRPVAVLLLIGTSGVGKTETAVALAELLYGGREQLTTINLSEFGEDHKVSQLLGTSAGYVGYGEGGVLTEAVRRRPYGVLLLDEVEKGSRAVLDVFLSVFDKGTVRDAEGRDVDFSNTLIVMTSNAASEQVASLCAAGRPSPDGLLAAVRPTLLQFFRPEFLGRTTPVVYYPLGGDDLAAVARLQLQKVGERVAAAYGGAAFGYDPAVVDHVVARCDDRSAGARVIGRVIETEMLPAMTTELLARSADGRGVTRVAVTVADGRIACTVT